MTAEEKELIPGPIEGYKGTDKDMKCQGFQFQIGMNILPDSKPLVLCKHGFHFCQQPSGPYAYNRYERIWKIRAYDILDSQWAPGADYKQVCRRIEIIREVSISGYYNTAYRNTGYSNAGNSNAGDNNTGDRNTGDSNAGYRNTGHSNTGHNNTAYSNAGNSNAGHSNAGNRNTGNSNTGDSNTGDGNASNYQSGFFCCEEPTLFFFDKPTEASRNALDSDFRLINDLCTCLQKDVPFAFQPYLSLPNATEKAIKALHAAHIERRKKRK